MTTKKMISIPLFAVAIVSFVIAIWTIAFFFTLTSSSFIIETPKKISQELIPSINEMLEVAQTPEVTKNENTRKWIEAIVRADTTPEHFLNNIGIIPWVETELADSLKQMSQVLKGERPSQPIMITFQSIRKGLMSAALENYLLDVLKQLPDCTNEQVVLWEKIINEQSSHQEVPACQPPDEELLSLLALVGNRHIALPSDQELFHGVTLFPQLFKLASYFRFFIFLLLLFPILFAFVGSKILKRTNTEIFQSITSVFVSGSILSFLSGSLLNWLIPLIFSVDPSTWTLGEQTTLFQAELKGVVLVHTETIIEALTNPLSHNIFLISVITFVVGLLAKILINRLPQSKLRNKIYRPAAPPS